MKFDRNSRVMFQHMDEKHRGRVTEVLRGSRRVVTDSGRRIKVPVRRLSPSPDRMLILEARLDRNLRSKRTYGPMMQDWLGAYDVEALYERVHTKEAMRRFFRKEGKNLATRFIHVIGHGINDPGVGKARIRLTFDDVHLVDDAQIFTGLKGKIILFSCCQIGADIRAMQAVKEASGAAAVIGYRVDVYDKYSILAEALLYQILIEHSHASPRKAVLIVGDVLRTTGAQVGTHGRRKPVLVCV